MRPAAACGAGCPRCHVLLQRSRRRSTARLPSPLNGAQRCAAPHLQVTPDKKCRVRATVLPESSSPDGGKKVRGGAGVPGTRLPPAGLNRQRKADAIVAGHPAVQCCTQRSPAPYSPHRPPLQVKLVGVMVVEGFARVDAHGNQLEIFSNRGRLP